ncbi:MAG: chemotaxis protein [Gammaproteobacteria bacterium]
MGSVMDGVNRLTQLVGRNKFELLLFKLSTNQRFGINVFKVREVIKCPPLTRMPHSHPVISGVANMRGQTITVMDLSAAIGRRPLTNLNETFVIVAEYNRLVLGFMVGKVDRIVNKNWDDVKPPPSGIGQNNYLTAVTQIDNELVEIIDVEKVLSEVIGLKQDVSQNVAAAVAKVGTECAAKIFIADDSAMARKQIMRVLEQTGVPYVVAENGRQAWELLLAEAAKDETPMDQKIAMVISDVEMPEMDGYTLATNIKSHPQMQNMFVCLHTSLSGTFNEHMAKRVKADKLIPKFDPDDLAKMVAERLAAMQSKRAA